ncbi:M1 family metallopeptidase [Hymenobacter sp. 15J16-1T3B]|uniref:M1 family metallopeptidase n=1 Tax=Hymenobacter sp. 15J16-1T3B TaxID=2886941 RepID=UPI001D0F9DD8|nr:M1 family metallopeptidase [Hymenobacter sp. 15J16-1T3B]MCC3157209.1 M1 family metallopeptidase [Hymenobacter sp. 15J16-1T3B]
MHKLLPGLALAVLPLAAVAQAPRPYWQQEVNYSIDVTLDDQQHVLTGREEMQYVNNSPDALPFIWIHLWPNAYKDNSSAFARQQREQGKRKFEFAKANQRGYIDQLDFRVEGQVVKLDYDPKNPDIAKLTLPQPLQPGQRVTISTPFRVKLPDSFSRMGHVGQSYQISQWYPKPAVYDRTGWHQMPYLDQGEFYSEFGSFDVRITLPDNYVVGATGELQNPDERARLDQLAATTAAKGAETFGSDVSFPQSAATTKTLRYTQDRVHDFAWFADKRFNVLKDTVKLPGSERVVTTWMLFTNRNAADWLKHRNDLRYALQGYSRWVGEYPYSAATAVDGALSAGSGMEYPMVTVTDPFATIHEVGHNWFYGILASNEREFPWMDEGVNSYLEARVSEASGAELTDPIAKAATMPKVAKGFDLQGLPPYAVSQLQWQVPASRGYDQAVTLPAAQYVNYNYGAVVYGKTAGLLRYLAAYLGQEKFDQGMHLYFDRWKFRHPGPADFQAAFEEASGQKLDWFFQQMMGTTGRYNAAVADIMSTDQQIKVLVRNESNAPWAVPVSTVDASGKVLETLWTPVFGGREAEEKSETEDTDVTQLNFRRTPAVAAVVVDAQYLTPQLNRRDDQRRLSGALPTLESVRLRPLLSAERWDHASLNWLPVLGANTYDKFMLGAAFYNNPLVLNKISYLAMPMFSFGKAELKGIGQLNLNALPTGRLLQRVTTSFLATRFERYTKLEPSVTLELRRNRPAGPQQTVQLAYTIVRAKDELSDNIIPTLRYNLDGGDAVKQYGADLELNAFSPRNAGTSYDSPVLGRAALRYEHYYKQGKSVRARLFGGYFFQQTEGDARRYFMGLSGSFDYRRQTAFLDRQQISDTYAAQRHQTDDRDGAFKAYIPVAADKWLTTLNLEAELPVTSFNVFADFGAVNRRQLLPDGRNQRLFYDAGLAVPLFNNVFRLYLPVAGSQYTDGLPNGFRDFSHRIRFVLDLQKVNPFRLLDQVLR